MSGIKSFVKNKFIADSEIGTNNLLNREKWLESTLKKIPEGWKILDAGAGELPNKKYAVHLNYVSQDFAKYTGAGREGLQTGVWDNSKLDIISDITSIPVGDSSFDAIMCTEVLEHLPNPNKALVELTRILKKGGYLIITAPFCSLTHFSPFFYSSGFSRYFYELLIDEYEIIELIPNGNYFEYLAQEIRRIPFVSDKYSNMKPSRFESLIFSFMLKILSRMNINNNSSELLCYGYHYFGKKK